MALVDHVIVLSHLGPQVMTAPPTITWEETLRKLGMEEHVISALPPSAREQQIGIAGEAKVSHSALAVSPSGIVTEVAWPCSCGVELHIHHDFVLDAWAKHVAAVEGIDADHLEQHAVQEIDGRWCPDGPPRIYCRCGERFQGLSLLTSEGLALWAAHVVAT